MNIKNIRAIEHVLLMNNDICELYEERGVSRDDLRAVFVLAIKYKKKQDAGKKHRRITYNIPKTV
jgi:predicted NUDIX family phosphoesterase